MADLTLATLAAIMARLEAPGALSAPAYSVPPDNTKPPVVVVGDATFEQVGGKNSNTERHDIVIRTFVGGTSKAALFDLMAEVKAALHNQPLSSADAALSRCVMTSGNEIRDIDEKTLVGEQRFFVFASPI